MLQKWICNLCGYELTEKPNKNAICENCLKGRFRVWNKCECGILFHPQRLNQKYCSESCGYKYRSVGGKKGKKYPHTQRARIAKCPVCKKNFRAVNDSKNRITIYCSKDCWSKRATIIKKCKSCGNEIKTNKSTDCNYCSLKCYWEDLKTLNKGENCHFWKGGKTKESDLIKRGSEYKSWRLKVFIRDNFICQNCGKQKNLEAHHIKEQSFYPELIFDVDNGITLCHECHKLTDNYGNKAKKQKL